MSEKVSAHDLVGLVLDDGSAVPVSQPSDDPLILVRGLDVAYGKTQVLFGVDFHVERGEIVALLGTNGAGKSTLLSAMTGLIGPKAGTVVFDGRDITGADPGAIVRDGIVLMPGGKGVFPTLTVEENLRLAGWIHDDDPAATLAAGRTAIGAAYGELGVLDGPVTIADTRVAGIDVVVDGWVIRPPFGGAAAARPVGP